MTFSRYYAIILSLLLIAVSFSQAQELEHTAWEVYVERDIDENGTDRLQFINLLTGNITTANVNGERYTPLSDYIMYYDNISRAVLTVRPNGTVSPHPFIQLNDARRVDWIISSDQRLIAWTLTYDNDEGLITETYISDLVGTNPEIVLADGPRNDGARVFPVAFSVENSALILDSQPDSIGDLAPYRQYAGLFQLSLVDGAINPLPHERSCFCAAALSAGQFIRLAVTNELNGFDVVIHNLADNTSRSIAATDLDNYTQGGNILISPDGNRAMYALSQIEIGSANPSVQTVIMLVNLEAMTQSQLSEPIRAYISPVAWTEDNSAILFTMSDQDGTWKIDLNTGDLTRIATANYIGVLEL